MKFSLSKKQIKIILAFIISLLIFFVIYIFIINKNAIKKNIDKRAEVFVPTFLDDAEKTRLNIRPENKIQVLERNAEGKIILYKVIRKDSDIVTNLDQITSTPPNVNK